MYSFFCASICTFFSFFYLNLIPFVTTKRAFLHCWVEVLSTILKSAKTYINTKSAELLSFQHCPRTISNFIKPIRLFHLTALEENNCNVWKSGRVLRCKVLESGNYCYFYTGRVSKILWFMSCGHGRKKCVMFVSQLSAYRERPKALIYMVATGKKNT